MSDFKFACPGCGQRISATDEYVGYQVNCPACHATIVVPANPSAPAAPAAPSSIAIAAPPGMPPPPAPPKVARLGVSALSSPQPHVSAAPSAEPEQQGSAGFKAHMARKPKKSYTGLITAVVAVALIGVSAFLNKDWLSAKWKSWRGPSAAEIAAANQPPPPPPELNASEIVQKVAEVYKGLPSFSSTGKATAIMDMSEISPALAARGPITIAADMNLKMSKPHTFHIDMTASGVAGNNTVTAWSLGNGDFIQANNHRTRLASHAELFSRLNSGASVGEIVLLFLDDESQGLVKSDVEWSRNKDEVLDGQPCYVLAGTVKLQNVLIWVSRQTFLIAQTQIVLDGKSGLAMDDAKIKAELKAENNGKEPTLLQIANVKTMFKIKGTVTETYPNIQTNLTFAVTDIQPALPVPPPRGGAPGQGGGPSGRATGIANGRRGGG